MKSKMAVLALLLCHTVVLFSCETQPELMPRSEVQSLLDRLSDSAIATNELETAACRAAPVLFEMWMEGSDDAMHALFNLKERAFPTLVVQMRSGVILRGQHAIFAIEHRGDLRAVPHLVRVADGDLDSSSKGVRQHSTLLETQARFAIATLIRDRSVAVARVKLQFQAMRSGTLENDDDLALLAHQWYSQWRKTYDEASWIGVHGSLPASY